MTRPLTKSGYDHGNELVDRTAPRWAWDVIDETLALIVKSSAPSLRQQVEGATQAMIDACENPD